MSGVIRVGAGTSVRDVEARLEDVAQAAPDTDLLLVTHPKQRQLGGTSALLQLVFTWHRRCPTGTVRCHVTPADDVDRAIQNFLTTDHGFLAFLLAGRLATQDGKQDLTPAARDIAEDRLGRMDDVKQAARGSKVLLACADHTPWDRPATLYARRDEEVEVAGLHHYRWLARETGRVTSTGARRQALTPDQGDQLGTLFRELVRNTHQWARNDETGRRYASSVRGLRAELHNMPEDVHAAAVAEQEPLQEWTEQPELQSDGRRRLVELSIFDTGPGLAARRMHELATATGEPGDEYQALRDCLRRHFSSSADSARGIGLDQVLRTLTMLRAFLRVRAGTLDLYRDFVATPYAPSNDRDEPYLNDWRARIALSTVAPVAGTTYTILFPLGTP